MSNVKDLSPRPRYARCPICFLHHEELHAQCSTVWVNGVEYLVPEDAPQVIHIKKEVLQ